MGVKKRIGLEIFNIFLKNKYLISYKDSKLIKKGVNFKLVVKGIEVYLKNSIKIIEVLVEASFINKNIKSNTINGIVNYFWNNKSYFQKVWATFLRILGKGGVINLTATMKFANELIFDILKIFKYEPIWLGSNQLKYGELRLQYSDDIYISIAYCMVSFNSNKYVDFIFTSSVSNKNKI